jgi:hypothetical protein
MVLVNGDPTHFHGPLDGVSAKSRAHAFALAAMGHNAPKAHEVQPIWYHPHLRALSKAGLLIAWTGGTRPAHSVGALTSAPA